MKKLYVLFFIVILCVCILSSCELLGHRHIAGEWQYSGENHWRSVSCTWNMCDIEPQINNHSDEDKNDICDLCGSKHEHIYGEWHFSETDHWCNANCTWNGCDIDTYAEHYDKDGNDICDACGYNMGQIATPTNYFLRNQVGAEWLNNIKADNITEIKIISRDGMVAPGCFKYISSSTDKTTILKIFEDYYWLDTVPVDEEETAIPDGGLITVQFILNNGTAKEFKFNNGEFYTDPNGNHFKLLYLPCFDETLRHMRCYAFETDIKVGEVWTYDDSCEPNLLGEIPMEEIEFIDLRDDIYLDGNSPTRYIETDFGRLYFLSEYYFYINDDKNNYYQLVEKTLDELIEIYTNESSVYSFEDLFNISSYIDVNNISSVKLDYANGSLGGPIMHRVSITTNESYINSLLEFINTADFYPATECYDGVGMYNVSISAGDKSFELSLTYKNEFYVNGICYNSSGAFPLTGLFNKGYEYIETRGAVLLSSYGNISALPDFDLSKIYLTDVDVDIYAIDYTKDSDLLVDGEIIKICSDDLIHWKGHGWYLVVSENDFSSLIPEGETTSTIQFKNQDGKELGVVILSNNTVYTLDELKNMLPSSTYGNSFEILNSDGSVFVDRAFTDDEILTVKPKTDDIAQIVVDYENTLQDEINGLEKEHPEYIYYYHPVDEVHCIYILDSNASADDIVAKYDMENVFAKAEVSALNAIKMISIIFDRNDFTEDMHQEVIKISEEESLIENLFVNIERVWAESRMPKIDYYTDSAIILNYEITDELLNLNLGKEFIIKSKEDYNNYLSYLSEVTAETGSNNSYLENIIDRQRDLYDEEFFEENALIITKVIVHGSGSIKLTVDNLYVSESKVYVLVRTDIPYIGTDDMQYTHFTFKVPKGAVANANEVITLE